MSFFVICTVALLASALTFFSGFGLGTLLLPAFLLFVPVEQAVALAGAVHFLNGLFKLALVGRNARWDVILRFGLPAIAASFLGAWLLIRLADFTPLFSYLAFGYTFIVTPVKLVIGTLLLLFVSLDLLPRFSALSFGPKYMLAGGLLSGFFGGLSGMQGALRSAFLVRVGLTKEAFISTGVVIATMIDLSRLSVYAKSLSKEAAHLDYGLLVAAVFAAFIGAVLGNHYLKKLTMPSIQYIVSILLVAVAVGLILGAL